MQFSKALDASKHSYLSAASYFETAIVLDKRRNPVLSAALDELILDAAITIEPLTAEQAKIARQAYRDYGRGSGHAANLNFGDCFSYALARARREPILFKGDDFGHTDLRSAITAAI
ncbi:MAG TPA: type II toxin-antitoxin system VapC family toxin [Terracidiphilus sp.]|nr:type II toxin-antitoxin system VapC family toxin [Terracidiphilus sp.]